jgi:hypothetical protein
MKQHSAGLVRDLRHPDADQVDEIFSSSFQATLLEEILSDHGARPATKTAKRRHRRSFKTSIVVGAAAVLVTVIVFQVVPGSSGGPSSAAAAVLTQAATAAGNQPPVLLGPGQFLYTETRLLQSVTWALGDNEPSWQFDTTQDETIQTWQAADGSGRELVTYNSPPQFTTPASQHGWVLSGEPSIASVTNTPSGQEDYTFIPSDAPSSEGTPGQAPADDAGLPTEPDSLRHVIEHGGPDIPPSVSANVTDPSTPAGTFGSAAEILETPATGVTPALRSALFQVMAGVQGVELLGQATDRAGRSGTEIASPMTPFGDRYEIIVDDATGQILQNEEVLVDPSLSTPLQQKYFGNTAGEVEGWTDYLSAGIVSSTSAEPTTPPS